MQLIKVLVAVAAPVTVSAVAVSGQTHKLRAAPPQPTPGSMVTSFHFDQQLIVCNAYPSTSAMTLTRNSQESLVDTKRPLRFRECRKFNTELKAHDKLDLALLGLEIHGTFEVGSLPSSDAVLLLVLQRRDKSRLVSFQSFAFPTLSESNEAQVAVIDAFKSNSSHAAHLKMEDHLMAGQEKAVTKRVEELNFDRVYTVEEGIYDASVTGRMANKVVNLAKQQSFVVLRTGEEGHFPESLVVFPEVALKAGAIQAGTLFALLASAIGVLFAA